MRDTISEKLLREYLLGTLDEHNQERVEQAYLTDKHEEEELSAAEEDLIEDYLDGNLSPPEQERFEQFFLQPPGRRQNLAITRSLRLIEKREAATNQSRLPWRFRSPSPAILWATAGLLVALSAISAVLYLQNRRLHKELALLDQARLSLSRQLALSQPGPPAPIRLGPGLSRDIRQATPEVRIPAGTTIVSFALQIADPQYSSFYVVLQTADGVEIWSQARLSRSGPAAEPMGFVLVPASILQPGDYQFVLWGSRNAQKRVRMDSYNFRIPN